MIGHLFTSFGIVGLASVVAWAAALAMLAVCARHRRRHVRYLAALGVAALGLVLAGINSRQISAIQTDRTDLQEAGLRAQQRARAAEVAGEPGTAVGPRFAEDAPTDSPEPAYRQRGKQLRETGKSSPANSSAARAAADVRNGLRMMSESDVIRANRLDRTNLFAARFALILALVLVVWDYLARFHKPFESWCPVPISGAWLDALFPRESALLIEPGRRADLPGLMETAVRRGETFLYFGDRDPWADPVDGERAVRSGADPRAGDPGLPRWKLFGRTFSRLPRLVWGANGVPRDPEFLFDAIWYNRYCVVVPDGGESRRLLPALCEYLALRQFTHARARFTVLIVWDCAAPLDEPVLRELLALAGDTNFQVVMCAR